MCDMEIGTDAKAPRQVSAHTLKCMVCRVGGDGGRTGTDSSCTFTITN